MPTPVTRLVQPLVRRMEAAAGPFERFRNEHPDFVEQLRSDRSYRDRRLAALASLPSQRQRDEVRKLLRDRRLHRLYAYDAIRRLGGLSTATPNTVGELATRFNAFAPVHGEGVVMRYVDKGSGRRWVHDFGPQRRMQQALVAAILRKLHPPLPAQKLFNGGMPRAFEAVETAYRNGMTHGVEVDFVGFYGSIRPERLAELLRPLPTSVVEHVVWDVAVHGDAPVVVGDTTTHPPSSAATGLFLGAATSPIVGERIVRELLAVAQLPDTITYADNLFVMGRTEQEVNERVQTIQNSVQQLEVGVLELRMGYSDRTNLNRRFEFLKREGIAVGNGEAGRIEWQPGAAKLNQYRISASEVNLSVPQIDTAANRVRHWRRSYNGWTGGDEQEAEYLAGLAARRFYADGNAANLTAAVHAVTIAYLACGRQRTAAEFIPTEGDPSGTRRNQLIVEIGRWWENAINRSQAPTPDRELETVP